MMKQIVKGIICIIVLGILSASPVLALEPPNYAVFNQDLSDQAFTMAQTHLAGLKAKFEALLVGSSGEQETLIEAIIAKIEDKSTRLDANTIKVYLVETAPVGFASAYAALQKFSEDELSNVQDMNKDEIKEMVESLVLPATLDVSDPYKTLADSINADAGFDAYKTQFEALRAALEDFVNEDSPPNVVKAFTGSAGNSRASVMTFYVDEDPSGSGTFTVTPTTTLVIATDE
ncbi:MAG: hypothetical protein GY801_25925 [bacterium]|nr:hypothetical protein [bacterium]